MDASACWMDCSLVWWGVIDFNSMCMKSGQVNHMLLQIFLGRPVFGVFPGRTWLITATEFRDAGKFLFFLGGQVLHLLTPRLISWFCISSGKSSRPHQHLKHSLILLPLDLYKSSKYGPSRSKTITVTPLSWAPSCPDCRHTENPLKWCPFLVRDVTNMFSRVNWGFLISAFSCYPSKIISWNKLTILMATKLPV